MSYEDKIKEQLRDLDTPKDFKSMTGLEVTSYWSKMESVGYQINTYGPERCAKYRSFAEDAKAHMQGHYGITRQNGEWV